MSDQSDSSDSEPLEKQDDKDADFNIEDLRDEIDSDDSFEELPENGNDNEEATTEQIEEKQDDCTGPISPDGHRFDRKLICIKYPGNVVNPDKAIDTLGGIKAISTTVDTQNRRLELRFRPDDGYSKPTCGDRYSASGFLLRIRVKKSRVKNVNESEQQKPMKTSFIPTDVLGTDIAQTSGGIDDSNKDNFDEIQSPKNQKSNDKSILDLVHQIEKCSVDTKDVGYTSQKSYFEENEKMGCNSLHSVNKSPSNDNDSDDKNMKPTFDCHKYENLSQDETYELPKLKILGRIDTEFKFTSLCDFQYLPMTQSKTDPKVLECIYDSIYPIGIPPYSWLKKEVPYFLPPAAFSRMDSVQQYVPKTETDTCPENVIGKNRKRQVGFPSFIYFTSPDIPSTPPTGIETAMKVKFLQNTHLEQMRQIFEDRPIWSRNALIYKTKFTSDQLKILLPSVAYYFVSGPWRVMWVKLGYDPRKDISARKYQTLDYRLKAMYGLGSTVKCKRSYSEYTLPYKSTSVAKQKAAVLTASLNQETNQKKENNLNENVYIYREGMVPPSRQMFYQYCDILVSEVQEMLAKLPDPLPGTTCHEKRGWLPGGFDVQCREIINKHVRLVLRKKMNIPADHPTSLPRKRKYSVRLRYNKYRSKKPKKDRSQSDEVSSELSENSTRKKNTAARGRSGTRRKRNPSVNA